MVGAVIVYTLSEMLRGYGEWRFVLLGLVIILVQRFAQNGLFPFLQRHLDRRAPLPSATRNALDIEGEHVNLS